MNIQQFNFQIDLDKVRAGLKKHGYIYNKKTIGNYNRMIDEVIKSSHFNNTINELIVSSLLVFMQEQIKDNGKEMMKKIDI